MITENNTISNNSNKNDFLSKLPFEIVSLILTKYTRYCVIRDKRLLFINKFRIKRLSHIAHILSRIPRIKLCQNIYTTYHGEPYSIVSLDICNRLMLPMDLENYTIQKYVNWINELCHTTKIYINKSYSVHSATDSLDKHTRRLCILSIYKEGELYPFTNTFSLPASELELDLDLNSDE